MLDFLVLLGLYDCLATRKNNPPLAVTMATDSTPKHAEPPQRTGDSKIFGCLASLITTKEPRFIWEPEQVEHIRKHIEDHPLWADRFGDLDSLLHELDLDGYGPEIVNRVVKGDFSIAGSLPYSL
ncbi:hypothetical protein F4777DRAFT_584387 [Nemania sp. FL0916]|nr:hypothetical protein F4777DRAFT_584387 [Nemania sp. FL0916]